MKRTKELNRSTAGNLTIYLFITLFGAFMILPVIYTVSNSLKPPDELWTFPPQFFVRNPTFKNFSDLFTLMSDSWVPFSRYFFNTVLVSVVGTGGNLILASLCAYSLSKHKFKAKDIIFKIIVLSLMFSTAVTAVPSYLILNTLGLIDTYGALIMPAFGSTLGLYLMKQFIDVGIPDSLLEAARIDGSGEWNTFRRIVMPLVKPAWLTVIIFSFQGLWNIGATSVIQTENLKTLNFALTQINGAGIARQGTAAAAAIVMMSVPVIMFIFSQASIVETVATSGMKD